MSFDGVKIGSDREVDWFLCCIIDVKNRLEFRRCLGMVIGSLVHVRVGRPQNDLNVGR